MNIVTIANYEELLKLITERYYSKPRSRWIFRGHSNASYSLIPKVGRGTHPFNSRDGFEITLFNNFKREAYPYVQRLPSSDWEWLTLAQHHGLPTRLLDWSYNPLVACYFSVASHPNSDGVVYALETPKRIDDEVILNTNPFKYEGIGKFKPNHVTERLIIQEGLFTIQSNVESTIEKLLPKNWKLEKLLISKESKQAIRYLLYRQGIHEACFFPGLDGLAKHLNWKHLVTPKVLNQNNMHWCGDDDIDI